MKPHYFEQGKADINDIHLEMAKAQGYVPTTCLLNGVVVMAEVREGRDPCAGCKGERSQCHGRPERKI